MHYETPNFLSMTIHLACNIDSAFVQHCVVTLVSIFENNRDNKVCAHIIAAGLSENEKQILTKLAQDYNNEIKFYFPDKDILQDFSIKAFRRRISMATYYRCLLSDILPESVDRVLYLDCDIVVRGNLMPFYSLEFKDKAVAVVEDLGYDEDERYIQLGYDKKLSYFNAGVLLVNLDAWRKDNVPQKCKDFFRKYPERIKFNDQDLLNIILRNSKLHVDETWNMQDAFYRTKNTKKINPESLNNPMIVHYTNRKPWNYDSQHPLRNEYFKYLDLTHWKGWRPLSNPINLVKRIVRLFPFFIGIRKPKYLKSANKYFL